MIDTNELRFSAANSVRDLALLPSEVLELIDRLEAAEKERDALNADLAQLHKEADKFGDGIDWIQRALQAEAQIEAMEQQEPFDADSDVFRSAFEAALKAGNWPATRQGDGYRSPSTQIAWRIAFSTVNRLKLYLVPGAQGE